VRNKIVVVFVLMALLRGGSAFAQEHYYLSQIANGTSGGSTFRTTFVVFNNTGVDLKASVTLTGDDGKPLAMTIQGFGTQSSFDVSVPAGGIQILQTDGSGALVSGAANVTAPNGIGVSAVFGIYDAQGNFVTEAGVGSSALLSDFVAPVDTTGQFNTGLAMFNPGAGAANVALILRDTDGSPVSQTTLSLPGSGHVARFVAGVDQFFPSLGSFRGTLLVHSSAPVATLVLRQNQEPLSYTSLPAVPAGSARTTLDLAHIASGSFAGGSFKTSFILFNLASTPTNVVLSLTGDNGSPFPVTIPGLTTGSSFSVPLQAGGSAFLQTDGAGPLTTGAATISAGGPIGASGIFTVFDPQGDFQTEAGVGDSPILTALTLPVDLGPGPETGVAFFNPAGTATTFNLKLLDASGNLFDPGTSINLDGMGHTAKFVSELFPGASNFRGSLTVLAPSGVAALTLRQNEAPLSYTTLPVVSGVFSGKASPAPVLPAAESGIAVTGDVTINKTLSDGFRLTGHIAGSDSVSEVTALRSDGQSYVGVLDPDTNRYLVAVDQGTYTLQVLYQVVDVFGQANVSLNYHDPVPVVVTQDTTRHITLTSPQVFSLSGKVSGLDLLPGTTDAAAVFTSMDGSVEGAFVLRPDGTYSGALPNGSYRASIAVPLVNFTPFQNQEVALYNLGSVNVSGGPVNGDLSIPAAAKLSGTVRASWLGSLALGIQISATDLSAPAVPDSVSIAPPSTSIARADPAGQYQMVLARGRSYDLTLALPLLEGSRRLGTVSFTVGPSPFTPTDATATLDFTLPDLPPTASIKGRISNYQGTGVAGALVTASTESVSGPSGIGFMTSTITDNAGNYSLTVLGGTGYRLQVLPPAP
jgi:hypothetical protein